ncbi:MAG: cation-transporting P-type ATPase, partial [Candidatus Omnitrophica bacterium]|nr:cation-transporting P-type ATPase [Candidatus Omnitrophota bacterium]
MQNQIDLNKLSGISDADAVLRIQREGYNELPSQRKRSVLLILFNVVKEPMLSLLLGCGLIYLLLGEPD